MAALNHFGGRRVGGGQGIFDPNHSFHEVGPGEQVAATAAWVHASLAEPWAASRLAAQLPARPMQELRGIIGRAGIARDTYWLRYFTFGGAADPVEFAAYLDEALVIGPGDHSMIDHAVWEIEQGWF